MFAVGMIGRSSTAAPDPISVADSRAGVCPPGIDLAPTRRDDFERRPDIPNVATDSGGTTHGGQHRFGSDAHLTDGKGALVCSAAGATFDASVGPGPVESLRVADLLRSDEAGPQRLRLLGRRAGALGQRLPRSVLMGSPPHRSLPRSRIAERMVGLPEMLVAAHHLRRLRAREGGQHGREPRCADVL